MGEVVDFEEAEDVEGKLQAKALYFLMSSGRVRRWRQMAAGAEGIAMAMETPVTSLR